jgi:ppGpp synthetase/RelA/SpoT-type nucleotidyltranferase
MNIDEYEQIGRVRYEKLAEIVSDLLERAIAAEAGYRVQQIQHRAKTIDSLTHRLKEIEQLESDEIESHRKDLAGCRIVFYTNNDVNRFATSGLLGELFDVDWDRSKFHQPRPGEKAVARLFQSYNYVLKLKADRTALLEYREFDGLNCEVQVQTSLNHAWAEMAHDTIYKKPELQGFGAREMKVIEARLEDAMRKHLLPAGYLFQRIATDVERLAEGKALFDNGVLDAVLAAKNNNERYEAVVRLKDDVLPHYDNIESIFPEICENLKKAWLLADKTETVPHETPFGGYGGTEPSQVTAQIAQIIEDFRFFDPDETYALIRDLYPETTTAEAKDQLVKLAERLASHTLQIWERYGPRIQVRLAEALSNENDIAPFAPIVTTIASEILSPEITGTTSSSDAMTFHRGVIVYSEALAKARRTVIDLVAAYAQTVVADEDGLRRAVSTLFGAGRKPHPSTESTAVAAMILGDLAHAVERITGFVDGASLNSRQDIESRLLQYWRWNKTLPDYLAKTPDVATAHERLLKTMTTLRDRLNADDEFVAFKTIVGFKSVFPHMWEEDGSDYERDEAVRHERQDALIDSITPQNWALWKTRLANAASIKSNDLATFPPYARFLSILADRHPDLAIDLLKDRDAMPDWTIRPIADALLGGDRCQEVGDLLSGWVDEGRLVNEVAALTAFSNNADNGLILKTATRAVDDANQDACAYFVEGAIRRFADDPAFWRDQIFFPCLTVLKDAGADYWVDRSWHKANEASLFSHLTDEQAIFVLDAMVGIKRVDYQAEQILKSLATARHEMILDWFGRRIEREDEESSLDFDPVPFLFQSVHEALQPHPRDVIASVRQWRDGGDGNDAWQASHFLSRVYPNFEEPLPGALYEMVQGDDADDLAFIVSSLQGYNGRQDLLPLFRAVLTSEAANDEIEADVSHVFHETGVMTGAFGPAQTYQAKADLLRPWLADENRRVAEFAAREIRSLERLSASETRRAQEEIAMRKLQYGETLDDENSDGEEAPDPSADDVA